MFVSYIRVADEAMVTMMTPLTFMCHPADHSFMNA